jgi:hypothetical protein
LIWLSRSASFNREADFFIIKIASTAFAIAPKPYRRIGVGTKKLIN